MGGNLAGGGDPDALAVTHLLQQIVQERDAMRMPYQPGMHVQNQMAPDC